MFAFILPLTIGNGQLQLGAIIKYGNSGDYSTQLLIATGFVRMLTLSISMNCGFIGGVVYPMVTIGAIAGAVCSRYYPSLPLGLCISCFSAAVPGGVVPMPFTLLCLFAFIFYFGLEQTVPAFVAIITSYSLVCGSGLMKRLQAGKNAMDKRPSDASGYSGIETSDSIPLNQPPNGGVGSNGQHVSQQELERERKEAEQYAMNQYLGKSVRVKNTRFEDSPTAPNDVDQRGRNTF